MRCTLIISQKTTHSTLTTAERIQSRDQDVMINKTSKTVWDKQPACNSRSKNASYATRNHKHTPIAVSSWSRQCFLIFCHVVWTCNRQPSKQEYSLALGWGWQQLCLHRVFVELHFCKKLHTLKIVFSGNDHLNIWQYECDIVYYDITEEQLFNLHYIFFKQQKNEKF